MNRQVLTTILVSLLVCSPVWAAVRLRQRRAALRQRRPVSSRWELLLGLFFFYIVILAAITMVPKQLSGSAIPIGAGINVVPVIHSIQSFLPGRNPTPEGKRFWLENIIGNVILFIPLGVLLPLISRRFDRLARVAAVGLMMSVGIELVQFLSRFVRVYLIVRRFLQTNTPAVRIVRRT